MKIVGDDVSECDTPIVQSESQTHLATHKPTYWPITDQFYANLATHIPTYMAANAVSHQHAAFSIITTSSRAQLAMYHHQSLGSPPASTLLKAIRNHQLRTFPGLTTELISKHLPPSKATAKGHMVRTRQGVQSTRNQRQQIIDARLQVDDMNPPQEACAADENEMFCYAALAEDIEGVLYSDQTGRFPVMSYAGMQYILIAYVYDKNAILMRPL